MTTSVAERLVNRLATLGTRRKASRRGFLTAATLTGTALALDPWGYLTRPQDAYASVCGTDAYCSAGWSAFCCSINGGHNTCPPNTYAGGWWKADRSSFCGGAARYYIDCNAKPGATFRCHCNQSNCDHRLVACNIFRYGQCNTQIHGVTAVVCRQISCLPPWKLYPGKCGTSSATDNQTSGHTAPCLTKANTYPNLVTFPTAPPVLYAGHYLNAGQRLVSLDRHTECVMQANGNFVIRNQNGVVWSTKTAGIAEGGRLFLRYNGRLVLFDADGVVRWRTPPTRTGTHALLRMRNNGQLTIYDSGTIIWHTNTHTP
ncbi:MAG: hypothetical protein QOG01_4635 [Pseudonocardiales bacterium]|jgi:hypothetical protein|nr:hypothetical protein [Pseudonocardiales bacterium]